MSLIDKKGVLYFTCWQNIIPCPESHIVLVYCLYKVVTESIDAVDVRSRAECESGFFGRIVFGSSDFHAYRCC